MMPRRSALRLTLSAIALALAMPSAATAGDIPIPGRMVTITAQGRPANALLEDLLSQVGIRARVSPQINKPVNGSWQAPANQLFSQLSRSLNLVTYYEGGVLNVYSAKEIISDSIPTAAPAQVVKDLRGITNQYNRVVAGRGSVSAVGVPAFITQVKRVAGQVRAPLPVAPPAPTPNAAPIVSPALAWNPNANYANSPAAQWTVLQSASRASPLEIRAFKLMYDHAADQIVRDGNSERVEAGVASRLRAAMGLSAQQSVLARREVKPSYAGQIPEGLPGEGSTINIYQNDQKKEAAAAQPDVLTRGSGPTVTADATQNMVIVRDYPKNMAMYEALVTQFDVPRRQIELEVAIVDISTDRLREFGIDFALNVGGLSLLFGGDGGNSTARGQYVTGSGDLFMARINGLQARGAARIVKRQQLIIKENGTETFSAMQAYPYELKGRVSYLANLDAGTSVRATPRIVRTAAGQVGTAVRLDIEDKTFNGTVTDQGLPAWNSSVVSGEPEIPMGKSIMFAGLTIDQFIDRKSKTPILGDIPLAGELFKRSKSNTVRIERMFLITPRIMGNTFNAQPVTLQQPISFDEMDRRARGKR